MSGRRRHPNPNPGTEDLIADTNLAVEDSVAAFAGLMQPFMAPMTAAIATGPSTAAFANLRHCCRPLPPSPPAAAAATPSIATSGDRCRHLCWPLPPSPPAAATTTSSTAASVYRRRQHRQTHTSVTASTVALPTTASGDRSRRHCQPLSLTRR